MILVVMKINDMDRLSHWFFLLAECHSMYKYDVSCYEDQ